MHAAARHIAILCHRHVGMAEMVGADPRRETGIVNERCYRLAEAMRGGIWHPSSARAPRHGPAKFSGSRNVPAFDAKITSCSPMNGRLRRSVNAVTAKDGNGIVRRPAVVFVSSIRTSPAPRGGGKRRAA